jgi:hypothetical protein
MAGTVARAVPFSGELSFGIRSGERSTLFGSGLQGGSAASPTLPAHAFSGSGFFAFRPHFASGHTLFSYGTVRLSHNEAGSFQGTPLAGVMPLAGMSRALWGIPFGAPILIFSVPLFTDHTVSSAAGAVGLGVGGRQIHDLEAFAGYVRIDRTVWQAGAVTLTNALAGYTYHVASGMTVSLPYYAFNGTAMYTGTDSRTPGGLGQITLVSPSIVRVRYNHPQANAGWVLDARLTLTFVPEPGTGLLLGFGMGALAWFGLRRLRGREDALRGAVVIER